MCLFQTATDAYVRRAPPGPALGQAQHGRQTDQRRRQQALAGHWRAISIFKAD